MKELGLTEIKSLIHPSLHNSIWKGWLLSSATSGCKDHMIFHYVLRGFHHLVRAQGRPPKISHKGILITLS